MNVQPYAQEGAARTSQVLHFNTTSSQPILSKTLPFRFRVVDWHRSSESSSLIGITSTWNIVICGDDTTATSNSVTSPKSIKGLTHAEPRKKLFRDIFGDSAFETTETIDDYPRAHNTFKEGSGLMAAIDVPSYSAPPIDSVFSSLMDGFLVHYSNSLNNTSENAHDIGQEEDFNAEDMDVDSLASVAQVRTVDDRELEDLVSIFRKQSISSELLVSRSHFNSHIYLQINQNRRSTA